MKTDVELQNMHAFDRFAEAYTEDYLLPAERVLLTRLSSRWGETDFLDLGVGAGRTAWVFAALARRYVGVDYAPRMIALAKGKITPTERVSFHVADATDLSFLGSQTFNAVLFSFNGLDYITHTGRLRALKGIQSRLRDADSLFLFSSHNLLAYPFQYRWRTPCSALLPSARNAVADLRHNYHVWRTNRQMSYAEARHRSWAIINDGAHASALETYYVTPKEQVRQLKETGLQLVEMLDMDGRNIDWKTWTLDPHLHYLCRRAH